MRLPARNRPGRPPVPVHKAQSRVIKCEHQTDGSRLVIRWIWACIRAGFQSKGGCFRPHRKNIHTPPRLGDARQAFRCHYPGAIGRNRQSHLISTREAACRNSWSPPRHGCEVLVDYALNATALTNPFLRFPRVRQQARGNFSFQYTIASPGWMRATINDRRRRGCPFGSRRVASTRNQAGRQ
jgi:hypothetical protein